MKNWIFLKGILQDLALSFILTCIFELSCFPPSYPPETRDLFFFFFFFVWKKSSEEAKNVILRHLRIFWTEAKDYSQ